MAARDPVSNPLSAHISIYGIKGVSSRQRRREGMQLARRRNVRCY